MTKEYNAARHRLQRAHRPGLDDDGVEGICFILSSGVSVGRLKDRQEAPADVSALVNIPTDITGIHCLANLE